jgi:hypothetical protein
MARFLCRHAVNEDYSDSTDVANRGDYEVELKVKPLLITQCSGDWKIRIRCQLGGEI